MKKHSSLALALLVAVSSSAFAQAARPARIDLPIPNIPSKSFRSVVVNYAPGQVSRPHAHAKSAFVVAYVLDGEIQSAVNGEAPKTYKAGEYWTENPGDHHTTSGNASKTKPAKLLAIFVLDTKDTVLTTPLPAKP
jgi:quercetin dioxygenase-like cupin family protein